MKKISILIPCYNEKENVDRIYEEVLLVINTIPKYDWEIVFADNCSTDGTVDSLRKLAQENNRVRIILNQANYGPYRSSANGMFSLCTDAVIPMACDLEDPPQLIPKFVEEWERGYEVVLAQYVTRKENMFIHTCRKLYYSILQKISDTSPIRNVTGYGLFDKKVIDVMKDLNEYEPRPRYLVSELGYNIKLISFDKPRRESGRSSYSFLKYYREAIDSLIANSKVPLHIASFLGFVVAVVCLIVAMFYLIYKLLFWDSFDVGIAPLVIGIFFLGAVQLFFVGILGEYICEVLKRITKRPYVIERERINFEEDK